MEQNFKNNLKSLRQSKGFSKKEIAEQLKITPQAYGKIENGLSSPSFETLVKLAEVLELEGDFNQLFRAREGKHSRLSKLTFVSEVERIQQWSEELFSKIDTAMPLEWGEDETDEEGMERKKVTEAILKDIKYHIDDLAGGWPNNIICHSFLRNLVELIRNHRINAEFEGYRDNESVGELIDKGHPVEFID